MYPNNDGVLFPVGAVLFLSSPLLIFANMESLQDEISVVFVASLHFFSFSLAEETTDSPI